MWNYKKYSFKTTHGNKLKPTNTSDATKGQPVAKNEEDLSEFLFLNRKYYKDVILKKASITGTNTHSFWKKDKGRLYGRVNFKGDSIYLPESQLSQIAGVEGEHYALAPVVDAFQDLRAYMREKITFLGNQLIENPAEYGLITNLVDGNIANSWKSFFIAYTEYLEMMSEEFIATFLGPTRERKITGFKTFYSQYLTYAKSLSRNAVLTPTSFLRSQVCPVATSGLVIEILDLDHGNDVHKSVILQTNGYSLLASAAKKFGFLIDENAPWRLIADIFSNPMRRYMANYGVPFGKDNIFRELYSDLGTYEIEYMRFYVVDQYNKYVQSRPTISVHQSSCKNKNKKIDDKSYGFKPTKVRTAIREPVDAFNAAGQFNPNSKFAKKYNELFWLRFYYNIRLIEEGEEMELPRFNEKFKDLVRYYRIHGQAKTVQAINRELVMKLRIF